MRLALPEEIEKIFHHNLISDSDFILPHIQRSLKDMMQEMGVSAVDDPTSCVTPVPIRLWLTAPELGHPLIDDNHDRPPHPLVGLFLRIYVFRYEDMDDDDDDGDVGHLYTGLCDTGGLARTMFEDWEIEHAVEDNNISKTIPNQHLRRNRERFTAPHTARDPNKVEKVEIEGEDLQRMIRQPPEVGAIRFHHEPESINTSATSVTSTTFQCTTSVITPRRPYRLEGARWHLPTKVFSNSASFEADLHSELLLQERLDENPKHRSFSWQVLRKASEFFGAKTYIGETSLTTPLFFLNVRKGAKTTWVVLDDSQVIVNWSGLDPSEQAEITPTLVSTDTWIICTDPLRPEKTITPPIPTGAQRILHTKGNTSRERRWWRTGTENFASAWTPKYGSVKTARSPSPASSPWKNSFIRNPRKIPRICAPMVWHRFTGQIRSRV